MSQSHAAGNVLNIKSSGIFFSNTEKVVLPSFRQVIKKEVPALVATDPVLQKVHRILLTKGHTNSGGVTPCQQNTCKNYNCMK